jgi:hypothetical protein
MKRAAFTILMFGFLASLFGQKKPDDFPPKPKWKPDIPVDLSAISDRARYYTDGKKTVVIFRHGTCVVLDATSTKPEEEAKAVLDRVYRYHPDFNPQMMDDGNFIVSYSQPNCFSVVTKEEFEKNREYIRKNHLDGVVRDEVLLNAEKKPNVFDERGMLGLFGRARMFLDAQQPVIARVLRPDAKKG